MKASTWGEFFRKLFGLRTWEVVERKKCTATAYSPLGLFSEFKTDGVVIIERCKEDPSKERAWIQTATDRDAVNINYIRTMIPRKD